MELSKVSWCLIKCDPQAKYWKKLTFEIEDGSYDMTQVEALLGGRSSYGYGALSYNSLRSIKVDHTVVIGRTDDVEDVITLRKQCELVVKTSESLILALLKFHLKQERERLPLVWHKLSYLEGSKLWKKHSMDALRRVKTGMNRCKRKTPIESLFTWYCVYMIRIHRY